MIKRLLHNKMVVFGTVVILAMIFLAVAAPWLTPYDYKTNHLANGFWRRRPSSYGNRRLRKGCMDEIDIRSQGITQGVFLIRNAGPLHRKYHRIYLRLLPGENGFLCWAYDGYHDGVSIYASVYDYRNLFWFHGNQNVSGYRNPCNSRILPDCTERNPVHT